MWKTSTLTDKVQILAALETDRLYAAYAIGDLEPAMFAECTWVGASEAGRVQALALHYRGLEPPALFLMGETDGLRAILAGALRAERVYLTCRGEHLAMTREFYAWDEVESMWRMVLHGKKFQPGEGDCVRLTPAHADELAELYALGGGPAYSAAQLERGVFFGTFVDRHLVAVAGTHLVSPTYGVAGVGNVFTHPEYRGRGYGTAVTSAVVAELLGRGIGDIVLNVNQANVVAIGIYERLGFERYCPFLEGPARALWVTDSVEPTRLSSSQA
jgi:ribosomal protein S18 acetylase RimI-like enzyme